MSRDFMIFQVGIGKPDSLIQPDSFQSAQIGQKSKPIFSISQIILKTKE